MDDVSFAYDGAETKVLDHANLKLSLGSRLALVGKNGAGKTTLLRLLVGELDPELGSGGVVWKHHNLRLAYIAQHLMHHLQDNIEMTSIQYIQRRFFQGRDREIAKMATLRWKAAAPAGEAEAREAVLGPVREALGGGGDGDGAGAGGGGGGGGGIGSLLGVGGGGRAAAEGAMGTSSVAVARDQVRIELAAEAEATPGRGGGRATAPTIGAGAGLRPPPLRFVQEVTVGGEHRLEERQGHAGTQAA